MAIDANTNWECRNAGSLTNGGGWSPSGTGVDYSQQNNAQYAFTNGTHNGTTVIGLSGASADMVGNVCYLAGGTATVTATRRRIMSAVVGVSITVDATLAGTGTGLTVNIGGAVASLQTALTFCTPGNIIWMKSDSVYSIATGISHSTANNISRTKIYGYTTTRGDNGYVTLRATAAVTILTMGAPGYDFFNLIFDGNSGVGTRGIGAGSGGTGRSFTNCKIHDFSSSGALIGSGIFLDCEIYNNATGGVINAGSAACKIQRCYIHNNAGPGIVMDGQDLDCIITDNVIANNSGASGDAVRITGWPRVGTFIVQRNSIYGNSRDGVRIESSNNAAVMIPEISNNIFVNNSGHAVNFTPTATGFPYLLVSNNAFYGNGLGTITNFTDGGSNITLTGNPFTSPGAHDFTLNTTAGAGAACRGVGIPAALLGAVGSSKMDLGAFQSIPAAAGTPATVVKTFC